MTTEMQQIMLKLENMEARQEERHGQNKKDVNVLFVKFDDLSEKVSTLNCGVHGERMKWQSGAIKLLWLAFSSVVLGGIVLGIWVRVIITS